MSVLEFIELSRFALAYIADKKFRMNWFEAGLNQRLKEKMSVRHYILYKHMYNTAINVEKATKEKNKFYNKQQGMKKSGDQHGNHGFLQLCKRPREDFSNHPYSDNQQHSGTHLGIVCNVVENLGITHTSAALLSGVFIVEVTSIK